MMQLMKIECCVMQSEMCLYVFVSVCVSDSNEEGKVTDSASGKQLPCLSPAC